MIATHNFLCGSANAPAPAKQACAHAGCTAYAFLCGNRTCDCATMHTKHFRVEIEDALDEAMKPVGLVNEVAHSQKKIGAALDDLFREVEELRMRHNTHLEQFS